MITLVSRHHTHTHLSIGINMKCKKTYERVTGVPDTFKRCIRGIDLLLERRIPLKLKTMVMTLNRHELWQIKEYAERLGVEFRFDPELSPRLGLVGER
ncbi:unnamed protein product [marine sediment metagenome]|uniref:Uncharacterized protein n=1 Tax=marine sediment metagenome TaxID=412755 RepID=X1D8R2_9ZZZZ